MAAPSFGRMLFIPRLLGEDVRVRKEEPIDGPAGFRNALRGWRGALVLLLAVYAIFVVVDFRNHGMTWDEPVQVRHGRNVVGWYSSGFEWRGFETFFNLRFYGAAFAAPAHAISKVFHADVYLVRHLLGGLLAVFAAAGAARIASRFGGARAAFFAALFLITTPRFFGHGFNNPVDTPFAAFWIWAVDGMIAFLLALPRPGRRQVIGVGVFTGLALGVRIGAMLVGALLLLGIASWWLKRRRSLERPAATIGRLALLWLAAAVIAWVVMLPSWPFLQVDPIGNFIQVVKKVSAGSEGTFEVLFAGEVYENDVLPRTYIWAWLVRVLPETYLAGLLGAGLMLLLAARRTTAEKAIAWSVLGLATMVPLLVPTITRPILYDGIRHFFFATVLLAVPAGCGAAFLLAPERRRVARAASAVALVLLFGMTLWRMARLHPYESIYFNRLVAGGLPGAEGEYETDYWGFTMREAALWVERHAPEGPETVLVANSSSPAQVEHYLPADRFRLVGTTAGGPRIVTDPEFEIPHYYLATTRWGRLGLFPGREVHRIEREGVLLLSIVEVDREAVRRLREGR